MTLAYQALTALSATVFLYYGMSCLFANGMAADFQRFGLTRLRILTGTLEVLGAVGLVAGQFFPGLAIISAGGLALLMALGLLTRVRLRDSLRDTLPAAFLMILNAYLTWFAFRLPSRALVLSALLLGTVANAAEAQATAGAKADMSAMTSLADSLERSGFSGSLLVADRREILYLRTMGLADQSTGRRISASDRWRWASISKQVTAALVLREVDAGRIALDVPVSTYLPGFVDGARSQITVRQLLQHTSGLPIEDGGPRDADGMARVYRERGPDVGDMAYARLCGGSLLSAPGTRFNYNNCDYLVLGALLRQRTGKSTEELLSELLGAAWSRGEPETVRGYLNDSTPELAFELATYGSAGAFSGTLNALLTFDRLLLGSLLSTTARGQLWRGEPKFGFAALGAWAFEAGLKGCVGPVRLIERRGAIEGVQTRNLLLPERDLIVIIFTNRADEEFGEVWQGRGLMYDVLGAAACASAQ